MIGLQSSDFKSWDWKGPNWKSIIISVRTSLILQKWSLSKLRISIEIKIRYGVIRTHSSIYRACSAELKVWTTKLESSIPDPGNDVNDHQIVTLNSTKMTFNCWLCEDGTLEKAYTRATINGLATAVFLDSIKLETKQSSQPIKSSFIDFHKSITFLDLLLLTCNCVCFFGRPCWGKSTALTGGPVLSAPFIIRPIIIQRRQFISIYFDKIIISLLSLTHSAWETLLDAVHVGPNKNERIIWKSRQLEIFGNLSDSEETSFWMRARIESDKHRVFIIESEFNFQLELHLANLPIKRRLRLFVKRK